MLFIYLIGAWILYKYGYLPITIYFSQRIPASPQIEPMLPYSCPIEAEEFFVKNTPLLMWLDFYVVKYFEVQRNPITKSYSAWFFNRQTREKAMLSVVMTEIPHNRIKKTTFLIEFSTRFTDDRNIDTSNMEITGCFKYPATVYKTRLPDVSDIRLLYAAHQKANEIFAPNAERILPEQGTEDLYLYEKVFLESYEQQIQFGLMRLDHSVNCYRLTLYGAYYMAWQLMWPVKNIRLMLLRKRSTAILRSLSENKFE